MKKPERSNYSILELLDWRESKGLEIVPKFQRRGVWTTPAKSYFIDTILKDFPVPPIYIRIAQRDDKKKIVRQVVDGQQRVTTVLDFVDGKYALSRSLDAPYAGKRFSDLSPGEQDKIRTFSFLCEVLHGVSDAEILEIFARVNTYSVRLNAQELRNGAFFGIFRNTALRLAHEHLEFWRRHGIFTERKIARMSEVEFASELIILQLAGLQDKKKSIDTFYEKHDQSFPEKDQVESRFRATIDVIEESVGEILAESEFKRTPLLYSLYGTIYHRRYGLPGQILDTPKRALTKKEQEDLRTAVEKFSDVLSRVREGAEVPKSYNAFVRAASRQTDNIQPRQIRLQAIYKAAFD